MNTNEIPNGVTGRREQRHVSCRHIRGAQWSELERGCKNHSDSPPRQHQHLDGYLGIIGGAAYLAGAPARDTVFIQNTGPQLLLLGRSRSPSGGGQRARRCTAEFPMITPNSSLPAWGTPMDRATVSAVSHQNHTPSPTSPIRHRPCILRTMVRGLKDSIPPAMAPSCRRSMARRQS